MRNMMKHCFFLAGVVLLLLASGTAYARYASGRVICYPTGDPLAGVQIEFVSTPPAAPFTGYVVTDVNGQYTMALPGGDACYTATVVLSSEQWAVEPSSGQMSFCNSTSERNVTLGDFVVGDPSCLTQGCWLTGGGARFSPITGTDLGESSRRHNWGGNVNPGCSPTAGDGGNWNHIDALEKLHFRGTHIEVVECGNVDGIPPGSSSPETPVNFIEFTGYGTLKGIRGNKVDYGTVYFFARAEDRNEPGSSGQRDGAGIDRYFLNVYTDQGDPVGSSVLLVDMDGNSATVDPLTITDGNMQMHISGCDGTLVDKAMSPETKTLPDEAKTWGALKSMYR